MEAEPAAERVVLGLAHALGAAGDDQVRGAGLHAHGGVEDGLEPGAAPTVQLMSRNGDGKPGVERGNAADGRRLAVGIALAEDDVVDVAAFDAGAIDQFLQDGRGQIHGGDVLEHAAVSAHRRPQGLADHCLAHGMLSLSVLLSSSFVVGQRLRCRGRR